MQIWPESAYLRRIQSSRKGLLIADWRSDNSHPGRRVGRIGAGREGPALRVCHAFAARDREKEAAVNVIFPLRLLEMQ